MIGTGSINEMDLAALSPLEHFLRLYPVLERHKNHIPFPQSGTIYCLIQIVRSIHSDFRKVKENEGQKKIYVLRNLLSERYRDISRIFLVDENLLQPKPAKTASERG
jgi:hypothetical protein